MGGCTSAITSDEPYAGLPDKSAGITGPHPTRAQVESAMGPAYIASAYWQLAVFRDSDLQKSVEFLWLPFPVPMMVSTDQLYRYILVEYDKEGLVTKMDSGLQRIPSSLKLGTDGEYVRLHLTAGDYDWVCAYGEEILLASPARRAIRPCP